MPRSVDIDRSSFYTTLTSLVFLAFLPSLFPCALLAPIFACFVYIWFELFGQFFNLLHREYSMLPPTVATTRTYTKRSPPSQTQATPNRDHGSEDEEYSNNSPPSNVLSPSRRDYGSENKSSSPVSPQPTQSEDTASSPSENEDKTQQSTTEDADQLVEEALQPPVDDHPTELREEEKDPNAPSPRSDSSEGSVRGSNVSVKFIQVQAKRVD